MSENSYEAKLKSSDLTLEDADYLGLKLLTPQETTAFHPKAPPVKSMQIPYYDCGGKQMPERLHRVRLLEDPPGFYGLAKKPPRFYQKPAARPLIYFPRHPSVNWIVTIHDPTIPIYITEGELKAACAAKHGLPCCAIGGVYSWMSKAFDLYPLPEFRGMNLTKRRVYLIFDSDSTSNDEVKWALQWFSETLVQLFGADVRNVTLPEITGYPKTGIDDFIVDRGFSAFEEYVATHAVTYATYQSLITMDRNLVLVNEIDAILNRKTLSLKSYRKALSFYTKDKMLVPLTRNKTKTVNTFKQWFEWPGRTEVQSLCFKPNEKPRSIVGDQFNTWTGLLTKPVPGSVEPWHSFLNHLILDPDERQWVERWVAWRFQNLHAKPFTSICLYSPTQGTGKTFFTEIIKAVIGKEYWAELTAKNYRSQFNKLLEFKLFAYVAEAYNYGDTNYSTQLKQSVTNKTINIELKGIDAYPVEDLSAWIFTSNHVDALYLDENDRRFYVVEVTDQRFPLEEANKIEAWYRKPEGRGALLHYFKSMDLGDFDAREPAPMTEAKHEMAENNTDPLREWVKSLHYGDINERFDGCILRTRKELMAMFLMETGEDERDYTTNRMTRALAENHYKKVNRGFKRTSDKNTNISFKIGHAKADTFYLMDRSQRQFYSMDHGQLVAYLKKHHGDIHEVKKTPKNY